MQIGCYRVGSHHAHAGPFPDDEQDVGVVDTQERFFERTIGLKTIAQQEVNLFVRKIVKLFGEILHLKERMENIESGIEGGVVAERVF